ncbi:hypothetical protein JS539_06980 [Bifidobacterium simiarum]|nr:hypothetical protein [Bifidobacterium simiarum]
MTSNNIEFTLSSPQKRVNRESPVLLISRYPNGEDIRDDAVEGGVVAAETMERMEISLRVDPDQAFDLLLSQIDPDDGFDMDTKPVRVHDGEYLARMLES